jgi:hypothetical protein
LQLKNQVKYLGVNLDEKLNWNSHIDHRMQKATIAFWQCRSTIWKTLRLKPKVVYWIYTSVVRPILTSTALLSLKKASQISVNRIRKNKINLVVFSEVIGRPTETFFRQKLLFSSTKSLNSKSRFALSVHETNTISIFYLESNNQCGLIEKTLKPSNSKCFFC